MNGKDDGDDDDDGNDDTQMNIVRQDVNQSNEPTPSYSDMCMTSPI